MSITSPRSFLIALLATIATGCSDYSLSLQGDQANDAGTTVTSTLDVSADEPETNSEDVDTEAPEADENCGFHLQNGPMDEAFTQTYLSYRLMSAEVDLVNPGEPMTLSFTVTANECGDAEIMIMQFAISDEVNFDDWLMEERNEPASIEEDDGGYTFDPAAANGIVPSKELHFTWSDGFWPLGYDFTGYMDTVFIPAGESVTLTFQFAHTELAPGGAVTDLMLSTIIWRDVGTEQEVQGWQDGHADMWTAYEFTTGG